MANEQGQRPKPPRKDPRLAALEHAPWMPTDWVAADALAMKRLAAGQANGVEQKRALDWILKVAGYTNEAFFPGADGARATDYALGKAHVGRAVVKLINIDLSRLKGRENAELSE